ncbi:MAG: hypothetical protein KDJ55_14395 [Rhodobiaceae bacterium]|nr:hypothetical protein [Rhodobiaceae bacterium]MCC0012426.1 hypothetical protein [Rhodobiaceae bacterium]MCC0019288.1 hypothetical protein [Rhodobiaceae bacterium]
MSKNVLLRAGLAVLALVCLGCLAAIAMIVFELVHRASGSARAGMAAGGAAVALLAAGIGLLVKKRI